MWYDDLPTTQKRLGFIYAPHETIFRVWSPLKEQIHLLLYSNADTIRRKSYPMFKSEDGVHEVIIGEDLKGYYYTYLIDGTLEVTDPYSVASSLNSVRSAIIDLNDSNPVGWEEQLIPTINNPCDAIIYEVHIKDFTGDISSGAVNRGKYLGFVEKDTKYNNVSTGLSHLIDLGVTHIHLLPVYDFLTVREEAEFFYNDDNYNWGYDPELYNVPEGSYSTQPNNPINRIVELKKMIMDLHNQGFKVIVDVVYNHTFRSKDSNFNILVPNYYYRTLEDGTFSNGSGCGNEVATRRPMVRKFIIDSLLYWVSEYKVDGFRFDLMALIDIDTMEAGIVELRKINPDIMIYGEPWSGGISTLPHNKTTTKGTQGNLSFALFNDNFRDAIKGNNDSNGKGFVQGNLDHKIAVETGITGSIYYDDGHIGFTMKPSETINYINSHDNLIITDKMQKVYPSMDNEGMKRLNKLAFSILLTSQGIPFIHAGNEFLRSKKGHHNTYNLPLSINGIDWSLKEKNLSYYNYFKDLIQLRKSYKAFRLTNSKEIKSKLKFMEYPGSCTIIAYTIFEGDKYLLVIYNANPHNCFISNAIVKEHLIKNYNHFISHNIKLVPVLDEDGLVEPFIKEETIEPYVIEIPYYATLIFEIE